MLGCLVGPWLLASKREKCSSSSSSSNPFSFLYFQRNFRHSFTIFPPATRSQSGTFLCVLAPKVEQPPPAEWGMLQICTMPYVQPFVPNVQCPMVDCTKCTIPYSYLYQTYNAVWYNALWPTVPNMQCPMVDCTKRTMPNGTMPYGRIRIVWYSTILYLPA